MFRQRIKKKEGFLLLELLIYIGISAIIIGAALGLFAIITRAWVTQRSRAEVQQNMRFALENVGDGVQKASAVTGTYPADVLTLTISGTTNCFDVSGSGVLQIDDDGTCDTSGKKAITSANVVVEKCTAEANYFKKISQTGAKDSVRFCFKIRYNVLSGTPGAFAMESRRTVNLR